jgi:plastocyanin
MKRSHQSGAPLRARIFHAAPPSPRFIRQPRRDHRSLDHHSGTGQAGDLPYLAARFRALFSRVALVCALLCPAAAVAASIEGRIELPEARATPVINQRYEIVAKAGVLSIDPPLAVVYLAGDFPKPVTPPVTEILQKDLTFLPSLLPVQVGTKVVFPNLDDTYHNIFSFSRPKRFDLGRYRSDERPVPSQVFDVAGLVTLRCDIHEHMRALILVLDTPHFVITNAEGEYQLTGLPEGRYTLKAWIDSKTTHEQVVELKGGVTLRVDFP